MYYKRLGSYQPVITFSLANAHKNVTNIYVYVYTLAVTEFTAVDTLLTNVYCLLRLKVTFVILFELKGVIS